MLLQVSAGADQASPANASTTLEADLVGRVFPRLPFDQPYGLRVKVGPETTAVKLSYLQRPRDVGACAELMDPRDAEKWNKAWASARLRYSTHPVRAITANGGRLVIFGLPALPPNVELCFRFEVEREMSKGEADAFRQLASEEIDNFLRTLGEVGDVTAARGRELRAAFKRAVDRSTEDRFVCHPGSICDETTFTGKLDDQFLKNIRPVINAQNQRADALSDFCSDLGHTAKVLTDPRLTPLLRLPATARDPGLRAVVAAQSDALTTLSATQLPPDGCLTLPLWHPDDLTPQLAQLEHLDAAAAAAAKLAADIDEDLSLRAAAPELNAKSASAVLQQLRDRLGAAAANLRSALLPSLEERATGIKAIVTLAGTATSDDVIISTSNIGDFNTRHSWYVSVDLGIAHAWDVDRTFPYAGINIFLRPINKDVPLRAGESDFFRKRFSLMVGLTVSAIEENGKYEGVTSDRTVLTAAGWRLLDSIRVSAGALWIREHDPNPLITDKRTVASPFAAISLDWDAQDTFTKIGGALGATKK